MSKLIAKRIRGAIPRTVPAAAKFLDKHYPGWEKLINAARLNMSMSYVCILGQLFGDAGDAAEILFNTRTPIGQSKPFGYTNGFNDDQDPILLAWKDEIKARLEGTVKIKMTTSDLKNGMRVTLQNGRVRVVIGGWLMNVVTFDRSRINLLSFGVKRGRLAEYAVVAVHQAPESLDDLIDNTKFGKLVWEQKSPRQIKLDKINAEISEAKAALAVLEKKRDAI